MGVFKRLRLILEISKGQKEKKEHKKERINSHLTGPICDTHGVENTACIKYMMHRPRCNRLFWR